MGNVKLRSVFGIFLIVVLTVAGCSPTPPGSGSDAAPAAQPDGAGASRNAGGVRPGDTNVTNLVATGDVEVGGDLTVAGECVGCGTLIETLDDIPTLSASKPMTLTAIAMGDDWGMTEGDYGVVFNLGQGSTDKPLSIGIDPEENIPYIGYDYLASNGTYIRFDDDEQRMVVSAGDLVLRGGDQLTLEGPVVAENLDVRPGFYPIDNNGLVTLRSDESGVLVSQTYANGTATATLPALDAGLHFCFFVRTGGTLTIDPHGSEKIDTLTNAGGDRISNNVAG